MVCMLASSMLLLLPGVACGGSEGESMLGGSGVGDADADAMRDRTGALSARMSQLTAAGARGGYAPADGWAVDVSRVFDRVPVLCCRS
jgi:hypothetical protein